MYVLMYACILGSCMVCMCIGMHVFDYLYNALKNLTKRLKCHYGI